MARNNKTNAESNSKTTTCRTAFPKGLSQPALRALASAELDHLEQLSTVTESSLLDLHGIGQNALQKLFVVIQIGLHRGKAVVHHPSAESAIPCMMMGVFLSPGFVTY